MTIKNLRLAIATAMTLVTVTSVIASGPVAADDKGDNMIQAPADDTDVATSTVDIWFHYKEDVIGYTLDIRGDATATDATGTTTAACTADTDDIPNSTAGNLSYHKTLFLPASELDCGQETTATIPGDGDAGLHLCKYTTDILGNGAYAVAVQPVTVGATATNATTEQPGACSNDNADTTNDLTSEGSEGHKGKNYQTFAINVVVDPSATTQAPNIPEPAYPAAGNYINVDFNPVTSPDGNAGYVGTLSFADSSPDNGMATWYELWVYDKDNNRVENFDNDNPTYDNWYKLGVDSSLICIANMNAAGDRGCSIDLSNGTGVTMDAKLTPENGPYTWWVRGYNDEYGSSAWSTAPSTFNVAE